MSEISLLHFWASWWCHLLVLVITFSCLLFLTIWVRSWESWSCEKLVLELKICSLWVVSCLNPGDELISWCLMHNRKASKVLMSMWDLMLTVKISHCIPNSGNFSSLCCSKNRKYFPVFHKIFASRIILCEPRGAFMSLVNTFWSFQSQFAFVLFC